MRARINNLDREYVIKELGAEILKVKSLLDIVSRRTSLGYLFLAIELIAMALFFTLVVGVATEHREQVPGARRSAIPARQIAVPRDEPPPRFVMLSGAEMARTETFSVPPEGRTGQIPLHLEVPGGLRWGAGLAVQ